MVIASSPGRICLFGEHQDFLGLPVISMAMNLRFHIVAESRNGNEFIIEKPDLGETEKFVPSMNLVYTSNRDYLKSSVNVLKKTYGLKFDKGYKFTMKSKIPVNAGCGSSSSMVVTWIAILLYLNNISVSPVELAELAFEAEVAEFGESGGKMDHYTAALGGMLYLDFSVTPHEVKKLEAIPKGFVLGDSLEPKETTEVLRISRTAAETGFDKLKQIYPSFDIKHTRLEDIEPALENLSDTEKRVIRAQIKNRDILKRALEMFNKGDIDKEELGKLLLQHHEMLRDGLGISTPKIERMLEAALGAGALGGKINGSGGGGTMFAYAPGHEIEVAEAIEKTGGKAFIISVDRGTIIEESTKV